ncbi:translocation/assembly module TamB domain-containing protein [Stakelama saccharophila]|uniref:Translocation/assembly module TamB domain-containing protein n=1 Tax=Stakelama saccharophila TaxID=3075605 RepID=A0ABZ0B6J1_9SPHN|nr:translocation/assembly module TamB domain-containing protein [Stakelama sp. W311]WNO52924.1 translocation/assembly module TamB domain-containing protein [Stakelama sp. W311]
MAGSRDPDMTAPGTTDENGAEEIGEAQRRPLWVRILKWIGIALLALMVLLAAALLGINTDPGRRFLANQIAGYTTASGLNVRVGRIDGSIYSDMVLRDVRIRDTKGVFASSPRIELDWHPFRFINSHVDVDALTSPLVRFDRTPVLKPTPSAPENQPLLPDIDIDVDKLAVDRIVIGAPVTGQRHIASVAGSVHIADRRAQVRTKLRTLRGKGVAGGDRLQLVLDAAPEANKLDLDLELDAPKDGLVAGLAGLKAPLSVSLDGAGSWQAWNGTLTGTLGGDSLVGLKIAEQDGRFQVRGSARPGLYLQGPVERLTKPRVNVALDAALDEREVDLQLRLRSDAFAVSTRGGIDLGRSRFNSFRIEALLLQPGAIAENLRGRSVRAAVDLDGEFRTPTVNYKLQAAALGFGDTVVERLYAEGLATVDSEHILVPVHARAARVTGLPASANGLLTNLTLNGDIAINGTQILSDNLRVRSDKIDATAVILADTAKGHYTGAFKGRVNDYRVDSIGILNLATDADLYSAPEGGFGIRGRIVARTSRILNDGARNFLGGNAYARVDLDYTPQGVVRFDDLRLNAPAFKITSGEGYYDLDGGLNVSLDAVSQQYGPISARATGTLADPSLLVRAAKPGLGIGLADLEARVRGHAGAYAVTATGDTNYGPFNADMLVDTGDPLTVDVRNARFAGVDLQGRIHRTDAGPFAGRLDFTGSGINGSAELASADGNQQAVIAARANNARIPGTSGITIGRAIIDARATLYPDAPAIAGDVQLANFAMGEFVIDQARAQVDYRGGKGTAKLLAKGSSSVPFQLAANARLSPDSYLVALRGSGNGIDFHTENPARIQVSDGSYTLMPTGIVLDKGRLRVAGTYGTGMTAQMRLDDVDLSLANAFVPGLGIMGMANGSLDFAQPSDGSFPKADARLNIADFRRSSIAAVSVPVNIQFQGKLFPQGGEGRALIKRGTTTVGRMVATLQPLPPGAGAWTTRLMAAPLGGGIRYNGPAAVLFSFAALSDQQLTGPIAVAANFDGRLRAPQLSGIVRSSNLSYVNETYGTRLTNMKVDGRFNNDRFQLNQLSAKAGDGSIAAQGYVGLAADAGFPMDIRATLDDARLARSDSLGATATGELRVRHQPGETATITGELRIPEARYEISRQGAAEVPMLDGVRRKGEQVKSEAESDDASAAPPGLFRLDIRVRADNRLFVSGMGLESEWQADIRVGGTSASPDVRGTMRIVRGTYSFAGKRFEISRGVISFEGGPIGDPQLNIQATTENDGVTFTINITGSAQNPQIEFASNPNLPQDEVLSRLLFGSSVTDLSATEAVQLAAALNSLRGSGGGLNPLGKLRSATGFDRLRILGSDDTTGRGTALAAGKYLTDDVYVEVITDARGFTATQIEISLTKALSLLSQVGTAGGSSGSIRYSKDY